MRKRLITVKNLFEYVQENELVIQADMIITPGAKDIIRDKGIGVKYEKCCCESESKIKNEIKNSMNISKNNEINNINKIDPWEYNHFLKDMKKRAAKKRGKK